VTSTRRLLIVGSKAEGALENAYADAFRELGVVVEQCDPEASLARVRRSRVINRLTWSMQHHVVAATMDQVVNRPTFADAVLVFKGYFLPRQRLRSWRARTGVPWLNLNPDSPFDPGRSTSSTHIVRSIPEYDCYFTWSRALVGELERAGARRAVYLPFAHDPHVHYAAERVDSSLGDKIAFVGSHDAQRARVLHALRGLPLVIFGNAWGNLPRRSPLRSQVKGSAIFGADLRRVVTSSLATINILRPQNAGSHNMRTFEVPAMQGLMLTTRSAEQDAFFPESEASLMFGSDEELRHEVEMLLRGGHDVDSLRRHALARSSGQTYVARARAIAAELGWSA